MDGGTEEAINKPKTQNELFSLDEETAWEMPQSSTENPQEGVEITAAGLMRKLMKNEFRCALSGVTLNPECASIDHITPLCSGGLHTLDNAEIVHITINKMKGEMQLHEFVQWCKRVASWHG